MLDAVGSKEVGKAVVQRLRDNGCRVEFFHEWAIRHLGVMNDRDHRKLCVIDGREAFVGGHCIVDTWLGDAQDHSSDRRRAQQLLSSVSLWRRRGVALFVIGTAKSLWHAWRSWRAVLDRRGQLTELRRVRAEVVAAVAGATGVATERVPA